MVEAGTLNRHWGYNKNDQDWKSPETIIRNLADIAGKGGNYLLNVGPTAEGTIPEGSIRTLREVGKWMKVNGDSIYGTTASPLAKTPWGRCTAKSGKLYLHVFDWPSDGKLIVPGLQNKVTKAYLLAASDKPCAVTQGEGQITVTVPQEMPDRINTVVVLEIQGDPQVSPAQQSGQPQSRTADGWHRQAQLGDGDFAVPGTIAKAFGLDDATRHRYGGHYDRNRM